MSNQLLSLVLILACGQAWAQEEPSGLQRIMRDLAQEMGRIAEALYREEYEVVASAARAITERPQPPFMERLGLLTRLGSDVSKFRELDKQVQESAAALGEAAHRQDLDAVLTHYERLYRGCLTCHTIYRAREKAAEGSAHEGY